MSDLPSMSPNSGKRLREASIAASPSGSCKFAHQLRYMHKGLIEILSPNHKPKLSCLLVWRLVSGR